MREELEARLAGLRKEFEAGQAMLREHEAQQRQLGETLLRISGAIQVLEDLLAEGGGEDPEVSASDDGGSVGVAAVEAPGGQAPPRP